MTIVFSKHTTQEPPLIIISNKMLNTIDICIVVLTVVFACILPYLHTTPACQAMSRFFVCVLVIALCVALPQSVGVPLALLLVLTSVPVLNIGSATESHTKKIPDTHHYATTTPPKIEQWIEHFKNAPDKKETKSILESFSLPKMNEKAIKEKLTMYEKVRSKQYAFEKQMEKINKNLKNVKEFYANNVKQQNAQSK